MGRVEVELRRASDDANVQEPTFQEELREFSNSLRATGATVSQRAMAFDSIDAVGYPLPEFVVVLGPAVVAAAAAICGAWVQARSGRKVRLKIDDVEAEARTVEEIDILLNRAATFRQADPSKGDEA